VPPCPLMDRLLTVFENVGERVGYIHIKWMMHSFEKLNGEHWTKLDYLLIKALFIKINFIQLLIVTV
jgi:hypothetical protein